MRNFYYWNLVLIYSRSAFETQGRFISSIVLFKTQKVEREETRWLLLLFTPSQPYQGMV